MALSFPARCDTYLSAFGMLPPERQQFVKIFEEKREVVVKTLKDYASGHKDEFFNMDEEINNLKEEKRELEKEFKAKESKDKEKEIEDKKLEQTQLRAKIVGFMKFIKEFDQFAKN